jgi:hypothetical protein
MNARGTDDRLVISLVVTFLVVGCAGASPSPVPASPTPTSLRSTAVPTPATAVSASPAPTQDPVAVAYGPVSVVTGTSRCPTVDLWGTADNGALVQWGSSRLENDGGAWAGEGSGVYSSDRGDTIAFWYTGTGGYAGLSYFELWTGRDPWEIQGQIFPGDPPTP